MAAKRRERIEASLEVAVVLGDLEDRLLKLALHHLVARLVLAVPRNGPAAGGTKVSLIGEHLVPTSTCHFGELPSVASTWVSSTEVLCATPAQKEGGYVVEISSNMRDFTVGGQITFSYLLPAEVVRVQPVLGLIHAIGDHNPSDACNRY